MLGIADRLDAKAQRLPLVERAAQLAQQRADAAASAGDSGPTAQPAQSGPVSARRGRAQPDNPIAVALERARQVWERVLAVEPAHLGAASALAPIYEKQEKWAKLITVLEIELAAAQDRAARLAKIAQIRQICEAKLTSRTLAFTWTLRAFDLDPESEPLYTDVLRLASEVEQWREVATVFEKHASNAALSERTRLTLFRELARIASRRLSDHERARGYHRSVLGIAPDDREAEQHLEEVAMQLHDWPELLASYRRRAAREKDPIERASLLIEIASLQEERLVDLDGAAATYHEALGVMPGQLRAIRAVARIEEARGDWESLERVLSAELAQTTDANVRYEQLMRLGGLEEIQLERPSNALARYREALTIPAAHGAARPQTVMAIARLTLTAATNLDAKERASAARLILPHLEASKQVAQQAQALEVIRNHDGSGHGPDIGTSAGEKLDIDRQLMRLYHGDLGDPAASWTAGLRVLAALPGDTETRRALSILAGQLGRDGEWARHLAVALQQLKDTNSSSEVRAVATELAKLSGERLADKATAERAWIAVLAVDADAVDAFEALTAMYRADQRWTDLRALLERRAEVTLDNNVRRHVLLELAALEEDVLGQSGFAMAAHRRVLELDASYLPSYQALDRLYAAGQQWAELEALLARQLDAMADSPRDHVLLNYRRAELFANQLKEPSRAVDLLEDVVTRQRSHNEARTLLEKLLPTPDVIDSATLRDAAESHLAMRVARLLEPLYEQDKQWRELVHVLRAQRRLVTGSESVELLSRIATIEESELQQAHPAFDAWVEVLSLDPTHERARVEISRLAQPLQRWPEATTALEAAVTAAPAGDIVTRGALLGELAGYYDTQLGDGPRAIAAYRRLLESDPSNPVAIRRAGTALARLYDEAKNYLELRAVLRKLAEWAEEPPHAQRENVRRGLLTRVAALEEHQLADRDAAIATWRDILADQPTDAGSLDALERLYQSAEKWRDLIEILRRKLEAATASTEARDLLARIAEIYEVMLEEPDEAIAAHLEALERDAGDLRALSELARLYREGQRHAELLDILEKQAQIDPNLRAPLQVEIAQLLAGPLSRPVEALETWKVVLDGEPSHPQALAAVEAALGDLDLRASAAEILRPVYDATAQYDRLARLQLLASEWTDEPAAKLRALGEVVRLREYQLGDKAGALDAQLLALQQAATEPELAQVVAETERLAGELGREGDLIDAYRTVAPNVLDSEIQRRLYLDVADLSRAVRRDLDLSRDYYQKVLDTQPDDRRALAALESIYRERNEDDRLVEVLLRQADAAGSEVEDRVNALVEAAELYATLGRPDDAISTWEQVLAVAPERRDAVDALEQLYRAQGRWPDVVDLYERRLGFATTVEEAVALRVQLGEIHETHLRDFETAIDNYSAALSGDQRNAVALAAVERYLIDPDLRVVAAEVLEPIYVGQQRWNDLIRVYEARLESTSDPRDRLKLTRFVARLYEEQLEDFEHASQWYAKVFREAPGDQAIRDQLQRLASMIDNWAFVAQTYQGYLDDEAGETLELREVAVAAALIYDRRLNDVDHAFAAYRRALGILIDNGGGPVGSPATPLPALSHGAGPSERELIRRLEELLARAEKWAELILVYDDVIARADDGLRRESLTKRARLLEQGVGDAGKAIEGWRDVVLSVEGDPAAEASYREAVTELDRLYRSRGQWRDLVDLYEARLSRSQHPVEVAELRLAIADVQERQLEDLNAAIDQHDQVISDGALWERAVASLERLVVHEQHRERIAELLEPVYRTQDWWQKLVVILDAKLDYVRDPVDQIATLHEIATIHEDRGGALDLALAALARAWRIDVADEESLAKLLGLAAKLEAWDDVVATLEGGAAGAPNSDLSGGLWARAAEIHENHRNDRPRAIAAWRKVDEARPDDLTALGSLDRLLALEGRTSDLVLVVARRAELSEDAGVRLVLLHRVAALYEEVLEDREQAIVAYKHVLGVDDSDAMALDALERLYRDTAGRGTAEGRGTAGRSAENSSRDLVGILERKIELSADVAQRGALRHAAAKVYETELDDSYQAVSQLTAILDDDAGEQAALGELDRIYTKQKMWPELLEIVDRRSLLAVAVRDRADLAYRAAKLVEVELSDADAAIPRYGAVLGIHPPHEQARAALEALMGHDHHVDATTQILERTYRTDQDAVGLARIYERRLALSPIDHKADWASLADVTENLGRDPVSAFGVWSRAIAAMPEDTAILDHLVRLAMQEALWRDLAGRLDHLLGESLSPDVEGTYAMKLGEISEDKLADLAAAARAYERAANAGEPRPALTALERVLARSNRWPDLAGVLKRQADATQDDAQIAEYLYRLGDLQETTLGDHPAAVASYREVLGISASHPNARMALQRMIAKAPDQRANIVEVLEPLFERDGEYAQLLDVLEARLEITDDPLDRASLLARILELAEQRLGNYPRALEAALRWLAVDPSSAQALNETDRLAERLDQWPVVAARVSEITTSQDARHRDPEIQVLLLNFLGRIQRKRLGQLAEAAASYRAALVLEPTSLLAIDDLVKILRQQGDSPAAGSPASGAHVPLSGWRGLAEVLRQRGRAVTELPEKRQAFAEVALISDRAGDRDGAIAAWNEYLDADDSDLDALTELAQLYRAKGDKAALIDTLQRAARGAAEPGEEKKLRVEIAQLETETPRAVQAWQAVLDLDGEDLSALVSLEQAYAKAGDWHAVSDTQNRRLALAKSNWDRVAIHAEIAKTAETQRGSIDDAIAAWFGALDVDASHMPAYDNLERLLTSGARWHDLVELLERLAELQAANGDLRGELATFARIADLWEGQLDNLDAAGEILEKILRREPSSVAALTRLSKIYERSGDWDKCKATLEQALKLNPTGRDAADLFYRLGEVARVGDSDVETAVLHFQQALKHDAGHPGAVTALEKLARERRDPALLADMLNRRITTIQVPAERVALLVELADLERKANRNDAALAALAQAKTDAPEDIRVLAPLADLYFAAGRLDEAAPIYDRLAQDAKEQRRMKDVARFRQRQGGILEARGDRPAALAAYEEALRVNPTDVNTMTGLGRLYFASADWEKARRIYQSLVLQNIDGDIGVTKGEVYWALGKIHLELDQVPKAKSMFQRGLEIEPQNSKLKEALSSLS